MSVGKLIYVSEHTQGIVDSFVFHNPLSLEEITHLQVLQQKFEMVVAMLAPPAGVENASIFQAEHKSGLLPRALRQCGHVFSPSQRMLITDGA
jgi:hypothetical protein